MALPHFAGDSRGLLIVPLQIETKEEVTILGLQSVPLALSYVRLEGATAIERNIDEVLWWGWNPNLWVSQRVLSSLVDEERKVSKTKESERTRQQNFHPKEEGAKRTMTHVCMTICDGFVGLRGAVP